MALSRSEVQLIISAKNEAQSAFDSLNRQITTLTGESGKATAGMENLGTKTATAGVAAGATGVVVGLLADRLARGLVSGFNDTIAAANRLDAGLIGLGATAKAFNVDAGSAQAAAQKLASDGLMTVGDAAGGLKNLLAAGFGLPEAVTMMNRFKDSAAFGRQGSLEFGQAIVGATEGIKNGNSALVDNAGVTKNLSVILQEAGYSANDLQKASSDVNVRMAIFNGILKETNPQLGNTALYLDTAAGRQAQFNSQVEIAQQKVGKALQPALSGLLSILTPVAKAIGDNADVLVPMAAGLAAVVLPITAVTAASALGIPQLLGFAGGITATGVASTEAAVKLYGYNGAVLTTTDGLKAASVSASGASSASKLASIAFKGLVVYELATFLYALNKGLVDNYEALQRTAEESGKLEDAQAAATAGMRTQANVISASIQGWRSWSEVIATAVTGAKALATGMPDIASKATLDAIGNAKGSIEDISAALKGAPKPASDMLEQLHRLSGGASTLSKDLAGFRDEIGRVTNAGGLPALNAELAANVHSTKEIATAFGISEDAVKNYDQQLKTATKSTKDHTAEAKALATQQQKTRDELEKLGIVTLPQVQAGFKEYAAKLKQATDEHVPMEAAVAALFPQLRTLVDLAHRTGIELGGMAAQYKAAEAKFLSGIPQLSAGLSSVSDIMGALPGKTQLATREIVIQNAAYQTLGMKTPAELAKVADAARQSYEDIKTSLGKSAPQTQEAYQRMIDAQVDATTDGVERERLIRHANVEQARASYENITANIGTEAPAAKKAMKAWLDAQMAETGRLPSYWQTDVFPAITGTVKSIGTAVQGSFAQMLLGAKGFGDGFKDIWESLKQGIFHVLTEIMSTFTNTFLKGLLNAMNGQQGALSVAFGGLFGGGGGGGLANTVLGSLPGTTNGAGMVKGPGGLMLPKFTGFGGTSSTTGSGAGFGAFAGSTLGGSLIGGGVGFGLGYGIGGKYGKTGGALSGIGSGALTGAMLGGPIGAGVGALAGLVGGLIGGSKNNTLAGRQDFAATLGEQKIGDGSIEGLYALLQQKGGQGAVLADQGLNTIGKKDSKGNDQWMKDVVSFLDEAKTKSDALTAATERYGLTWEDMDKKAQQSKITEIASGLLAETEALEKAGYRHDAILQKQAESYSQLAQKADETGTSIPASLKPTMDELERMGLLVDANGNKFTATADDMENASRALQQAQADYAKATTDTEKEEAKKRVEQLEVSLKDQQDKLDFYNEHLFDKAEPETQKFKDDNVDALRHIGDVSKETVDRILAEWERLGGGPVNYPTVPAPPVNGRTGGRPVEGGAADGVMADRPGLVLFGEGGETEVGGPKSFFQKVFKALADDSGGSFGGSGGGGSVSIAPVFNIYAIDGTDAHRAVREKIAPMFIDLLRTSGVMRAQFNDAIGEG